MPEYNSGYKLVEFKMLQELKYNPTPTGYLILEHSGDPRKLKGVRRETAIQEAHPIQ